jgi:hypothetical protein
MRPQHNRKGAETYPVWMPRSIRNPNGVVRGCRFGRTEVLHRVISNILGFLYVWFCFSSKSGKIDIELK